MADGNEPEDRVGLLDSSVRIWPAELDDSTLLESVILDSSRSRVARGRAVAA
jgi:hypothetical protein